MWRLLVLGMVTLTSCATKQTFTLDGHAQGTTYHIAYVSDEIKTDSHAIDSVLKQLDNSLSIYVKGSTISRINRNEPIVVDKLFTDVFNKGRQVSEMTNGIFDMTVGPLVNAYGFGSEKRSNISPARIDSLLQFVGYRMVSLRDGKIVKEKPHVILDFNAIAQGYSVDVIASHLEQRGVQNYLVELGGEILAKGYKDNNERWTVGIDRPEEDPMFAREMHAAITLHDRAMATSGNYTRYFEENGKRYAHIINPHTGYTERHNLLSASVVAQDCMTADAYATVFMVMGMEKAKQFLTDHQELGLEVFFIYDDGGELRSYASASLKERIVEFEDE